MAAHQAPIPPRPAHPRGPDLSNSRFHYHANWNAEAPQAGIDLSRFLGNAFKGVFHTLENYNQGRIRRFLLHDPVIDDIDDEQTGEGTWEPVRLLGQGGFGQVCLWRKYDAAAKCVDEMAIKECIGTAPVDSQDPNDVLDKEGLMTEAVVQRDLNTVRPGGDEFLSFLREYKYCRSVDTRRLYLEYAPYGDLRSLRLKYYVWSEYIPEGFVWHTLISLLEALLVLERRPPHDTEWNFEENKNNHEKILDDYYTLHLDLKPENILLDYETDANPEIVPNLYPSIKVSDFGLSRYVTTDDRILDDYPDDEPGPGTLGFQPPEQTGWGEYWWGQYSRKTPWTSAHNVWTVGKIVFDLICHTDHNEVDDLMRTEFPYTFEGEKIFKRRRGHFMVQNWDPLFTKIQGPENTKTWYYSPKLKDIIRDCLFPESARRPPADILLRRAKAGRDTYLKSLDAKHNSKTPAANRKRKRHPLRYTSPAADTRLYFREINAMRKGPMKLNNETQRELYKPLRRGHDPDYPMLRPPPKNWAYLGLVPPKQDENNKSVPKMVLKNRATGEILHTNEFDVYFDDHSEGEAELTARYDHGDDSGGDEDGDNGDNEHDPNEDDHIAAYDSEIRVLERKITSVTWRRRNLQIRMQRAQDDGDDDTNYRRPKTTDFLSERFRSNWQLSRTRGKLHRRRMSPVYSRDSMGQVKMIDWDRSLMRWTARVPSPILLFEKADEIHDHSV